LTTPTLAPVTTLPSGTVTLLMSDIEGSTRLLQELGPEWTRVLEEHHQRLREAFGAHGGAEVGVEGDSFLLAFATPADAVVAAVAASAG
jgi:class 3 adenylate cyclase